MNSAQRRPSTSPPRRRPTTIRESCDNCGISKIKCDRRRPRCLPCLKRGLGCLYSPSRRSATHSVASSAREVAVRPVATADLSFHTSLSPRLSGQFDPGKTKSSAHSPQDFAQYVNFSTETVSDACACEKNRSVFDMMAESRSFAASVADMDVQGHVTSGHELPVTTGFEDDLTADFDFDALCADPITSVFLEGMPRDLPHTPPELDTIALAQNTNEFSASTGDNFPGAFSEYGLGMRKPQNTTKYFESCSDETRTCMVSALKILQTLHIPPSACLSACDENSLPSPRQPRMLDSVLSTNRDVVLLVSDMLKCTCSLGPKVQLVLTIICGKLIAWYRAMIRNDRDRCDNSSSSSSSSFSSSPMMIGSHVHNNMNDDDQIERVLHQPITVGEYSFDVALGSKIRAHLVLSELRHLETLVGKLSQRIQEAEFEGSLYTAAWSKSGNITSTADSWPPAPPPEDTRFAESIHRSVSAFLHKQLRAAKAETAPLLSDEHVSAPFPTPTSTRRFL